MPLLINEVVAEVETQVVDETEKEPLGQRVPLSPGETEIARTLELLEQRRRRLEVD